MLLQTWINLFPLMNTNDEDESSKDIWRMLVTKELLVAIDFHIIFHAHTFIKI